MKVLVADDSQIMRKIIMGALKKLGVEDIVEVADGKEALAVVSAGTDFSLVLMDWNMPVMNGLDVVKKMRSDGIKTPVIMVTTESEKDKVLMAIKAGATDYLVKPFNPKNIQTRLEKFLQPT